MQAIVTGQIKVPINPFLGLLPRSLWNRHKDFFTYGVEFLPLAASEAGANGDIAIQADSDFMIIGAAAVVTDTSDAAIASTANAFDKFNPPFLVTLTDTGSGRAFSNIGIAFKNLFGTAEQPAIWTFPKLIRASSVLTTKIQNLVATAYRVRIAYTGIKIFSYKES
jgi:hypothetical protein